MKCLFYNNKKSTNKLRFIIITKRNYDYMVEEYQLDIDFI